MSATGIQNGFYWQTQLVIGKKRKICCCWQEKIFARTAHMRDMSPHTVSQVRKYVEIVLNAVKRKHRWAQRHTRLPQPTSCSYLLGQGVVSSQAGTTFITALSASRNTILNNRQLHIDPGGMAVTVWNGSAAHLSN